MMEFVGGRRKLIDQARFIENNTQAGHDGKIRINWIQVNSDIKKINCDVSSIPELCRLEGVEDSRAKQLRLIESVKQWKSEVGDCDWICRYYDDILGRLEAGKSVCTSNKALVAKHGPELMEIAREKNINFLFEASCGGGIPIIRALNSSLTADEIDEITGILNGTTNYMMYKMSTEGCEFDAVLKEAQAKGYAEADPTADVEGYDACRKIAILSSLAYGRFLNYEDIYTEGITRITPEDMQYAEELDMTIKLLGTSRKIGDDSFYAMVAPFLVGKTSPLYSVNDVFNAVFVHGNVLGDAMFYGSGAGKLPTASAVVADVVDEAKHLHRNIMTNWSSRPLELIPMDEVEGRFFVRVKGTTVDQVKAVFDEVEIVNLKSLPGEFGFITTKMKQGEYKEKVQELNGSVITMIRVKD